MRACRNCGTELDERSAFCPSCGASQVFHEDSRASKVNQETIRPKTMLYVMMVALALMGILAVGLAVRGPGNVTQTSYVTQMQLTTISFTSSTTTTQSSTMTVASFSTLLSGPPANWFNQQYCGYPFNPYLCNEGPPVTVTGYLTNDTSCVDLYVGSGKLTWCGIYLSPILRGPIRCTDSSIRTGHPPSRFHHTPSRRQYVLESHCGPSHHIFRMLEYV